MLQFIWNIPEMGNPSGQEQYVLRGGMFIRTQEGDFPCSKWQDIPLVLMANFLTNAVLLVKTANHIPRYHAFRPYYVVAKPPTNGMLTLRFLRSYAPENLEKLPPLILSFREYRDILLETGQAMLDTCQARGIGIASEKYYLENSLLSLRAVISD
ncbi:MAG: hypothetical protein WCD86_00670 [Ktedonobacteraceae bacterium]